MVETRPRDAATSGRIVTLVPQQEPAGDDGAVVFESSLRLMRLASALQLAESEAYSGVVRVGDDGEIQLQGGRVIGARALGRMTGVAAAIELLMRVEGRLVLALDARQSGATLARTLSLIMDGAQQIDEWREIANERWAVAGELDGDADTRKVVADLAARMARGDSLDDAVMGLGLARFEVSRLFRPLVERGAVTPLAATRPLLVAEPVAEPSAPPAPESAHGDDLDDLVLRARAEVRAGRLSEAEALFRRALVLRPNDRVIAQNLRHVQLKLQRA
ncbi:MAG: DUF4388 domain-containing protein [Myxococcota bacterium]